MFLLACPRSFIFILETWISTGIYRGTNIFLSRSFEYSLIMLPFTVLRLFVFRQPAGTDQPPAEHWPACLLSPWPTNKWGLEIPPGSQTQIENMTQVFSVYPSSCFLTAPLLSSGKIHSPESHWPVHRLWQATPVSGSKNRVNQGHWFIAHQGPAQRASQWCSPFGVALEGFVAPAEKLLKGHKAS